MRLRSTRPPFMILLTNRNTILYVVHMPRRRHPKKDVEEALGEAETAGWRVESTGSGIVGA